MRKSTRILVSAAAVTGLLSGAAIHSSRGEGATNSTNSVTGKTAPTKEPKVESCSGQNDCKGLGGCKSGDNGCKFKNSCKGKGGCEITDKDIKNWEKAHGKP